MTINCMSGLLEPSSGHFSVEKHDIVKEDKAARRPLGIVPQELATYEDLPASSLLQFVILVAASLVVGSLAVRRFQHQ